MLDLLLLDMCAFSYLPPLGLLYIATYAESRGFSARVHALQGQLMYGQQGSFSRAYLKQLLDDLRPRVVGIPVYAESEASVVRLCRRIREYSDARILLGGPQATADPFHLLNLTQADALVMGDGELRTVQVLEAFREGRVPSDLRGLLFRHNGEICCDPRPAPLADLNRLPFPNFSLMLNPDSGVRTMVTGRGCPFRCTFCFEGRNVKYRLRNLDNVLAEMRALFSAAPVRMFAFLDDTFTLDKSRVRAICQELKTHFQGPWFCEGRIEVLYRDPEIIDILADAGLTRLQLGLESGSPKVLKAYRKNSTPEQIREVFRRCHDAGITSVIGNFIVGGAFEDNHTFRQTLEIAQELIALGPGSTELLSCYLFPYKGTAIQERPQDFDLEFLEDMPLFGSVGRVVCFNRTRALTRGEISQYKMMLDGMIHKHMLDQVDTLPPAVIERHLRFARENNIYSEWYQTLVRCQPLALFARQLIEFGRLTWSDIRARPDWLSFCPVRVGHEQMQRQGDTLVVTARRNKPVRLAGLDRRLFELSSGKLSLEEMLPFLKKYALSDNGGHHKLIEAVWQSNQCLSADFLLVYGELF